MASRKKTIGITLLTLVLIGAASFGAFVGVSAYVDSQYASMHQGCSRHQPKHVALIENNVIYPEHIVASKCDTLTIKNLDSQDRIIAFGVHEDHVAYDGVKERELRSGESFTVSLIQLGEYLFHDHMDEDVMATFEVK